MPALVTGFSIDGVAQPLAEFNFSLTATPLEVRQNPAADASCQRAARVHVAETSGFENSISRLLAGSTDLTSQIAAIFGATRLEAWGSLRGTICFGGIAPPATITLTADGAGYEPGVYNATIVIESMNAQPQQIAVPAMFVLGGSSSGTAISGVTNGANQQTVASPGMVLAIFGSNLANTTVVPAANPMPYSAAGVSATVNGVVARVLLFVSPTLVKVQVPYTVGVGPGVVGINNNGQIAGFPIELAAGIAAIGGDAAGLCRNRKREFCDAGHNSGGAAASGADRRRSGEPSGERDGDGGRRRAAIGVAPSV
ncbi:MAG TPA: hypothetical protein VKV17_18085 [Bryobacteraceae bacterium]|nr:hypothetical protein [Bryobacteraceae bacterium]